MSILVTGGAGYIGSHTCVELLNAGYEVVVVDNLSNACKESLERVKKITGKNLTFYEADILDREALVHIFEKETIESVIHFAGLKAVGESVSKPLEYYQNNISGTLVLCDVMRQFGVKNIVFSSSATVYGRRHRFLLQNSAQREPVQILMDGRSGCWNRFLQICIRQTVSGMSSCSAILILSEPMRAV